MPSSSSEQAYVPLRQRAEWADVRPVPQDEGPHPVVPIAYTEEFRDVMDYFRAVYVARELSPRALRLTTEALLRNPGNYTIWHFRRLVIDALDSDLVEETLFVDNLAKANSKNYQIWHHKRWLAEKLGPEAANDDHDFTRFILCHDAKNYHAWSHRQWVLQKLGGWDKELDFCHQLLEEDIFNNSAWNQRFFVITRSPLLGGLSAMWDSEVDYTIKAILQNPNNESPWRYLQGLYKGNPDSLITDERIPQLLLNILKENSYCVFAWNFLLDVLCKGLRPNNEIIEAVKGFTELDDAGSSDEDLPTRICSALERMDPIRVNYWAWRKSNLTL
ncbi:Protein farnesyltransferase/geranylgeranyltransferase type-1 subunit alpha [Rhynchospora pubera]|uniref:Protein farnesyltransferase/geranylgeranyltransferase type-1 subunit alpha n=1 Tax=Rhynchospora pubera TaxID=906938 RepID=A0AAV8GYC0_9POAL|nr:Protein farnesyltransferase/geranylgeranyltransferase type-1 subunit alpha [Rhynchospora pubera]KAJ4807798.1 Protein farnesyltransferase/geranylgeranyltransferase type-1 subunit alpha [Rhynchospora pubera]